MDVRSKGKILVACVSVLLLFLMVFSGPSPLEETRALNRAVGPEPGTLDPHLASTLESQTVLRDLFEGLLSYSPEGKLRPGAAERWDISADGLHYTFWLRPEARWSNGEAVIAQDFVYSFRRLVDPATAAFYAEAFASIRNAAQIVAGEKAPESLGVEALDRLKLGITLHQPTPYFLSQLAQVPAYPVNQESVTALGTMFTRPGNLVSNGAYTLERWELGQVIVLGRNDHYWNNAATAIDVVRHYVTPEPSVELFRYRAGELHITSTVPSEAFVQVREQRPLELRIAPRLGTYYYGLNLHHAELGGKPALRAALSMSIDREALTQKVTGRGEQPAYSWVPPGVDNYQPRQLSFATMSVADRLQTARRLYREAGYSEAKPLQIELRYNTSETHQRVAVAIQAMWREALGFEATLINEDSRVLVANMRAMEITQIFRSGWSGDYNDAQSFLAVFGSDNPSNLVGYSSKEYDTLLQRAAAQSDPGRRRQFLEEAERVLLADQPLIPIYYFVSKHLVVPEIQGWQDNVLDYHYSQHLSFDEASLPSM